MDWLTFISKVVTAVVWPAVVVLAILTFRSPMGELLTRVRTLKWKDAEASFSEQLAELRLEMTDARGIIPDDRTTESVATPEIADRYDDLDPDLVASIDKTPTYARIAIDRSWQKLANALYQSALSRGVSFPSDLRWTKKLCRDLGLTSSDEQAIRHLRHLRNIALYDMGTGQKITSADAQDYGQLVGALMPKINAISSSSAPGLSEERTN